MYLYFNKNGDLTTKIPHGEIVRQGNSIDLYICFPLEFSQNLEEYKINVEFIKPASSIPFTLEADYIGKKEFYKLKDSEVTFDLIDGKKYHTFYLKCSNVTVDSGILRINFSLKKDEEEFFLESTEIFIEKTIGFNKNDTTIDNDEFEYLKNKIEELEERINILETMVK